MNNADLVRRIIEISGINVKDENGRFKPLFQVVEELSLIYDRLSSIEQDTVLDLVFGKRKCAFKVFFSCNSDKSCPVVDIEGLI